MSDPTVRELVEESLEDDATLHALIVTGEEESAIYALGVRTEPHQGDLMLKERYLRIDLEEETVRWTSNGINRRVTGEAEGFATGMVRAYARVQHVTKSGETPDEPLMADSRGGSDSEARELFESPVGAEPDDSEAETELNDRGDFGGLRVDRRSKTEEPDASEGGKARGAHSSATLEGGVQPSHVVCEECEREIKRTEAVNMGGALGTDYWVCADSCDDSEEVEA